MEDEREMEEGERIDLRWTGVLLGADGVTGDDTYEIGFFSRDFTSGQTTSARRRRVDFHGSQRNMCRWIKSAVAHRCRKYLLSPSSISRSSSTSLSPSLLLSASSMAEPPPDLPPPKNPSTLEPMASICAPQMASIDSALPALLPSNTDVRNLLFEKGTDFKSLFLLFVN